MYNECHRSRACRTNKASAAYVYNYKVLIKRE